MGRRALILLVLCMLLFLLLAPSGTTAPRRVLPDRGAFVPDEVLVAFRPGAAPAVLARAVGGRVQAELEGLGVHLLKVPPHTVQSVIAALSRNPAVEFAEPNVYLQVVADPDDPYDNTGCYWTSGGECLGQWAWATVNAYAAWDVTTGSAAVRVAVVDTGLDVGNPTYAFPDPTGHEDIVSCQTPIVTSFVEGESGNDDHGHGTHVAGTIGACTNNATGVAGAAWAV